MSTITENSHDECKHSHGLDHAKGCDAVTPAVVLSDHTEFPTITETLVAPTDARESPRRAILRRQNRGSAVRTAITAVARPCVTYTRIGLDVTQVASERLMPKFVHSGLMLVERWLPTAFVDEAARRRARKAEEEAFTAVQTMAVNVRDCTKAVLKGSVDLLKAATGPLRMTDDSDASDDEKEREKENGGHLNIDGHSSHSEDIMKAENPTALTFTDGAPKKLGLIETVEEKPSFAEVADRGLKTASLEKTSVDVVVHV